MSKKRARSPQPGPGTPTRAGAVRTIIVHHNQCDPRKCTALSLVRAGLVETRPSLSKCPSHAIILDPFADRVISADDANAIRSYGLVAMDCSWVYAEEVFARRPANGRRLPRLLAGNSVNYGRWERLSTAEALAAALVMVGEIEQAQTLLARFKWGPNFFVLNAELLDLEIGWKKSEQTTD